MSPPTESIKPYADLHKDPQGPTDGRPTALKIIEDEGLEGKWSDKVVLVTGTNSGIGVETARALHHTGAKVFMTVRAKAKADPVIEDIMKTSPSKVPIEVLEMELSNLASVRKAANDFLSRSDKLNIMVNNAAIMASPFHKTDDGFEAQIGINHLSHFLLFSLLKDTLLKSSTPSFHSRVVNVSSAGHGICPVDVDNINFEKPDSYQPMLGYGASKTANVWFANEIDRRYGGQGLHGLSLHPGVIMATGLTRQTAEGAFDGIDMSAWTNINKSVPQGAATQVWAATAKVLEGKGALYLSDCQTGVPMTPGGAMGGPEYAPWAFDEEGAKKLWAYSEKAVGVGA
ncbi:Short chain dehydrogenase-like protein 41 [Elsinoe fawcettii]|nr:Short chain dehydrogenase-like protein 41 [Elsinoe fawcettii]